MSLWQWSAALNGYIAANSPKAANKLSEIEAEALFSWIGDSGAAERQLTTLTYWLDGEVLRPAGPVSFLAQ